MTNAVTLASLANSGYLRNRIINGAMSIWQRGTSGFTSGYFTDRFFLGGTISAAARSTDVPSGFLYSASISGSNFPIIYQRIESVNTTDLVGQDVTISFWLKQTTGAGTGAFAVSLFYPTAVDNYTSATQIGGYVSINTISSWARYTVTFNSLPSGAANGLALGIGSSSSGSSVTLITGVQLEVGTQATPFEWRPYPVELNLCQRYYEKGYPISIVPGTVYNATTNPPNINLLAAAGGPYMGLSTNFKVTKRIVGSTITVWDNAGNSNKISTNAGTNQPVNVDYVSDCSFRIYVTSNTTSILEGYWASSAEL